MVYLTWREVYEKAKVNQSTSSFQREKFLKFYNYTGFGRNRKYEENSVDVLVLTSTMYASGKTFEEILEALEGKYGVQITNDVVSQPNTSTTQQDVISAIKEAFREEVKALEDKIDLLATEARERDIQSQSRDAVLMDALRAIREKNEKKWWRFGR